MENHSALDLANGLAELVRRKQGLDLYIDVSDTDIARVMEVYKQVNHPHYDSKKEELQNVVSEIEKIEALLRDRLASHPDEANALGKAVSVGEIKTPVWDDQVCVDWLTERGILEDYAKVSIAKTPLRKAVESKEGFFKYFPESGFRLESTPKVTIRMNRLALLGTSDEKKLERKEKDFVVDVSSGKSGGKMNFSVLGITGTEN